MSQEERAFSFKVRASNFMVVESASDNEKTAVVKGTMLHKVMGTLSSRHDRDEAQSHSRATIQPPHIAANSWILHSHLHPI